jgi:RNA polymerase sigma-70 factor (ECF subfamily)
MPNPTANLTSIDDQDLLKQVASGDQNAMSEFYDRFHSAVYHFALKRMREPSDAAEVLNLVMLEVWKTAGRFEGRSKVRTWLLGITNHKIIDALRKIGRHEGEELTDVHEDESQHEAIDLVALSEHAGFIQRCMEALSDAHRQVVHLAFFEDLVYTEIADIMECPEGTVKTRMYHAKTALKKCLKKLLGQDAP